MNGQYKCNPSHPENLIHKTMQGHLVRSKSEVIIANTLYMNQIPYRYENQLEIKKESSYIRILQFFTQKQTICVIGNILE